MPIIYHGTVIRMLQNHRVGYLDTTKGSIFVSQYYHDNANNFFFKFYNYIKTIRAENLAHFLRNMYVYKQKK